MKGDVVLLVEDNEKIMAANRRMLELAGYKVRTAATLDAARADLRRAAPDLIVLDIMLPDGSGLALCGELRRSRPATPILFLSVLNANSDIVAGLRAGGDDYLTKPYDYEVLLARIEALLRRTRRFEKRGTIGPFSIDAVAQRVYRNGRDTRLKPREYALFQLLVANPGVFFAPETLYEKVWALKSTGDVRTIYTHVSSLRRKLGITGDGDALTLERKRGSGYRLLIRE